METKYRNRMPKVTIDTALFGNDPGGPLVILTSWYKQAVEVSATIIYNIPAGVLNRIETIKVTFEKNRESSTIIHFHIVVDLSPNNSIRDRTHLIASWDTASKTIRIGEKEDLPAMWISEVKLEDDNPVSVARGLKQVISSGIKSHCDSIKKAYQDLIGLAEYSRINNISAIPG